MHLLESNLLIINFHAHTYEYIHTHILNIYANTLVWIFTHLEHIPAICMQQQFSLYAGDLDGRRCRIRRRRRTYFCVSYSTRHPAEVSDPINCFICTTRARISRLNYSAPSVRISLRIFWGSRRIFLVLLQIRGTRTIVMGITFLFDQYLFFFLYVM